MNLLGSRHQGILGVLHIQGEKKGPKIVISCLTHGGETAGLDVINFLYKDFQIQQHIKNGQIFFMINNLEAYKKYLHTGNFRDSRYIDENMNRSANSENISLGMTYESQRLKELYPLLIQADYHIDLHSTTQSSNSMAIYSKKSKNVFRDILNVDHHLSGILDHQRGKPVIDICERNGGISIGLESGRQEDKKAYYICIDNVLRILSHLNIVKIDTIQKYILPNKINKFYTIYDKVFIKDKNSFSLVKNLQSGQQIKKGEIIAYENKQKIFAAQNSIIILPSDTIYTNEEYCFLAYDH